MSRCYHSHPVTRWKPENWPQMWAIRADRLLSPEAMRRRNEIQAFRLELAKKEPRK